MIVGHPNSGKTAYEMTLKPLEQKFTMVYYDPRGTGDSEAPKTLEEYRQKFIVSELESLRKKIGVEMLWLFGHSDQSSVALQYAVDHPMNVAGMILSGTSYIGTNREAIERRKVSEEKRIEDSDWFAQVIDDWDYMIETKSKVDALGRDISYAPIKWWCYDEETAQKVIPVVDAVTKAGRRKPINDQAYRETPEERQRYLDYQERFSEIKADILILNGRFDTNNPPEYARKLNKELPNSTLVLMDKAGHFPWLEQQQESFESIFQWLDTLSLDLE